MLLCHCHCVLNLKQKPTKLECSWLWGFITLSQTARRTSLAGQGVQSGKGEIWKLENLFFLGGGTDLTEEEESSFDTISFSPPVRWGLLDFMSAGNDPICLFNWVESWNHQLDIHHLNLKFRSKSLSKNPHQITTNLDKKLRLHGVGPCGVHIFLVGLGWNENRLLLKIRGGSFMVVLENMKFFTNIPLWVLL